MWESQILLPSLSLCQAVRGRPQLCQFSAPYTPCNDHMSCFVCTCVAYCMLRNICWQVPEVGMISGVRDVCTDGSRASRVNHVRTVCITVRQERGQLWRCFDADVISRLRKLNDFIRWNQEWWDLLGFELFFSGEEMVEISLSLYGTEAH